MSSDFDASTAVGSEDSFVKPDISTWQPLSYQFDPILRGAREVSPISPLTVRDPIPQDFSPDADVTDSISQSSFGPSDPAYGHPEPDFEGVSLQRQPFSRPRSQRSSTISSRRAPVLLAPLPGRHAAAARLFIDPLGPPSDVPFQTLGLPSLRHILNASPYLEEDEEREGVQDPVSTIHEDNMLVKHLETLQRDAAEAWAKAAAEATSEQEREKLVDDTAARLWQASVSFLAELLRARRALRQVTARHRTSLGELGRLRQYSEDAEEDAAERERGLSGDLDGLRAENRRLRALLTARDREAARDTAAAAEEAEMWMGAWLGEQQQQPGESVGEEVVAAESEGSETDESAPGDWAATAELPGKEQARAEEAQRRESWQLDPATTVEMLQLIEELREKLEQERVEKEAAQEQIHQLEQEAALFHGLEPASGDDLSIINSARGAATKRMAEIAGVRAALKTKQHAYEVEKAGAELLRKKCDELEVCIAEKDHAVEKLQRELRDVEAELEEERKELTEVRLEAEERDSLVADLRLRARKKTAEISRLDSETKVLIGELNAAQASLVELRAKNENLAKDLYDEQTANGMQLQDLEHERYLKAQEEAAHDRTKDALAGTEGAWSEHCNGLENQIKEYEEASAQHEASEAQHKATETQLQKDLDLLNNYVTELEVVDCDKTDEIQALEDRVQQLGQDNQSIGDVNKRLAEYLKSVRQEEGWERLEQLRLRCQSLKKQRAAWAPVIREMAVKRGYAEQRYRQARRALKEARQDLEELQQQRVSDAEHEKKMLARIAFLERECENARLALQYAQLRLAGAKQIEQAHEREVDDLESILAAIGGDVTGTAHGACDHVVYLADHDRIIENITEGLQESVRNLIHTALPQPPIVARTVEHRHSEACFCSLVEYWFPGALSKVLPPLWETEDSGYDTDNIDVHDDPTDSVSTSGSDSVRHEVLSGDSLAATNDAETSQDEAAPPTSPTNAGDSTYPRNQDGGYDGLGDVPLRDGAGSPSSPASEASSGIEEMEMPASTAVDNRESRPITPQAGTKEGEQEVAEQSEAQHPQGQSSNPQSANAQPPRTSTYPRRPLKRVSFIDPVIDPADALLDCLDSSLNTPPLSAPAVSSSDDMHYYTRQIHYNFHGHASSGGPFNSPGHFVCQLLTALAWLAMLVLSQPSTLLSTTAVFAGYFLLPLGYILSLAAYYIRLPLFYTKHFLASLFSRSPHAPARRRPVRPAKPVLGRVSATAMVSSVVSLAVVFLLVALEAVRYEREIWLRPNRWTDAYLRDIVDRRPYPWWCPVDADFRLAALEWVKWKVNVWAFGERYLRTG